MTDHPNRSAESCDLKPCPFCGGPAHFYENEVDFIPKCSVACDECPAGFDACEDTKAEVAALWNARTGDVAQGVVERATEEACRRFSDEVEQYTQAHIDELASLGVKAHPAGKITVDRGNLRYAFIEGARFASQPSPAATVATEAAKTCNSYLQRALDAEADALRLHREKMETYERAIEAEAKLAAHNGSSADSGVLERTVRRYIESAVLWIPSEGVRGPNGLDATETIELLCKRMVAAITPNEPQKSVKPAAWMSREHIEAYMTGNQPGVAWASPQQTDFFDVALYAAGAIERAAVADQIIGQIEERFPNWRSYRDLIDCIDCTLRDAKGCG